MSVLVSEPLVSELGERPPRRWLLVLGWVTSIAFFVLATGLEWVTGASGLIWASVMRGIYVWIRRRRGSDKPFLSPWLFVLAGVLAAITLAGQRVADEDATSDRAAERGIVSAPDEATPADRCVTKVLDQADTMTAAQRATIPSGVSIDEYARKFCNDAASMGALASNGDVRQTDQLMQATCVNAVMANFDTLREDERRFTREDFTTFSERYCAEAVEQDLLEGARNGGNSAELEQLQQTILDELLASGEITERQ